MSARKIVQRMGALGALALGALGYWFLATGADTQAKPVTPQPPAVTQAFRPCHPPGGDMSLDGTLFVTLQQDQPTVGLLEMEPEQKHRAIPLPKPPADAVFLDTTRLVVSYGPWGELAVLDTHQATVGAPFRVGASAGALCRLADGRVVVLDAKHNRLYVVDPLAKAVVHTLPVPPRAAQLGWAVPELALDVADALGQRLGTVDLPRPSAQE